MLNTRTDDPDFKEVFTLIRIINNKQNDIQEYAELIDFLLQKNMYYHAELAIRYDSFLYRYLASRARVREGNIPQSRPRRDPRAPKAAHPSYSIQRGEHHE